MQQLRHHQKGLPAAAAQGGDALLGGRQLLQRQAAAQITPGHRHHVAEIQPVRQGVQSRPVFHLGEQLRMAKAVGRHGVPDGVQIAGAADEGLHDRVHAQLRRLRQIGKVGLAQSGTAEIDALRRQALMTGEDAAPGDAAHTAVYHGQRHGPVVQQDGHAGAQRRQHILLHRDIRAQRHRMTLRQRQGGGQRADAYLRAPQIDHQLGGKPRLSLGGAEGGDPVRPCRQRRVGQVQPEAGNAPAQQRRQRTGIAAGGAEGGVVSHGVSSL